MGAAVRALCNESNRKRVQCTSLKSNLGHLEAAAAAAGLSSLIVGPLLAGAVAILFDHSSLRSIADALSANSHLSTAQEPEPEQKMPVLPTVVVAHEVTKRVVSQTSGNTAQSVSSIIKSIQTTL